MRHPRGLTLTVIVLLLVGAIVPPLVIAHQEDAKSGRRPQPYVGAGYRAGPGGAGAG